MDEAARPVRQGGRAHTLEEIERISTDAGISEAALQRALVGETAPARRLRQPWSLAGAPRSLSVERTVRARATSATHAKVVKAMRSAIGEFGSAQTVGESFSWSVSTPGARSVSADDVGELKPVPPCNKSHTAGSDKLLSMGQVLAPPRRFAIHKRVGVCKRYGKRSHRHAAVRMIRTAVFSFRNPEERGADRPSARGSRRCRPSHPVNAPRDADARRAS